MKELPFISCKTLTYGRVNTLEEAIESFLKQDYPPDRCELIIVNDYPLQTLKYDHPNIHIYNEKPFKTIGEKENFSTNLCKGEIICQWDDDDIALPNHLKNVAKYFTDETNLLHWKNGIFYNEPIITSIISIGNSGIVYRKSTWNEIGKFPIENAGCDTSFTAIIHGKYPNNITNADPKEEEASWFYRWGMASENVYHQSGMGTDTEGKPNILQRHAEHVDNLRIRGLIPTGIIELQPKWKYDYEQMLKEYVNGRK